MAKKDKKFSIKSLLTFQNFIILGLIVVIAVMLLTNKKVETERKENFELKLNHGTEYTYCQKIYHYNEDDRYNVIVCEGRAYAYKNQEAHTQLEIENVAYVYKFLVGLEDLIYLQTKNGDVYYLSMDNLINQEYKLEKLDLKNIAYINEFYIGKTKADAYSSKVYAVDKDGNFHLIKSGS